MNQLPTKDKKNQLFINYKKTNIKTTIIILLLVVASLSFTYAYMLLNSTKSTDATQAGCFVVNYTGQSINNASLQSTKDYTKGEVSNIVLSKNQDCTIYTEASIYIHTNSSATNAPLSNGALKYKIMNGSTEVSSGSIKAVTSGNEEQLLATVPLTSTTTTYKVYLWIDSSISKGSYNEKTYSGYLYASSTQSSAIK